LGERERGDRANSDIPRFQLSLPLLLRNDGALLKQHLSPEDLAIVLAGCSKYPVADPKVLRENLSATMDSYHPNDSMVKIAALSQYKRTPHKIFFKILLI